MTDHPTSRPHRIAVIPGDGIGTEVMPEGVRALRRAADLYGIRLELEEFDWSSAGYWQEHGRMLPEAWYETLRGFDAIFFGAVGWPDVVPDHVSLWESLLKFRREFDQYVNLRPVKLLPGVRAPLRDREPGDIDFLVVRENTEGEYSSIGGRIFEGTERETVMQETVMTRIGVDRILTFAFEQAERRGGRLTSATKSNGISVTMPYWDERVAAMSAEHPGVEVDKFHIDILTANFVLKPDHFDVVVASNLFGDILSDLGPACTGTIGVAPPGTSTPPRSCLPLRTGPRLGTGHRRPGHRQPHRTDLGRGHGARLPGPPGGRRRRRHRLREDPGRRPRHDTGPGRDGQLCRTGAGRG